MIPRQRQPHSQARPWLINKEHVYVPNVTEVGKEPGNEATQGYVLLHGHKSCFIYRW